MALVVLMNALGTLLAMDNVVIINNVMIIPIVQAILPMSALMMHAARNSIIHVHPQERNTSSRAKVCFKCGIPHVDSSFKCDAPFDPSIFHKMKELSRLADNVFEKEATDVAVHERLFELSKKGKPTKLWSKPVHKKCGVVTSGETRSPHIQRFLLMEMMLPNMSLALSHPRSLILSLSTLLAYMCLTSHLTVIPLHGGSTTTLSLRTKMALALLSFVPRRMWSKFAWDSSRTHATRFRLPLGPLGS